MIPFLLVKIIDNIVLNFLIRIMCYQQFQLCFQWFFQRNFWLTIYWNRYNLNLIAHKKNWTIKILYPSSLKLGGYCCARSAQSQSLSMLRGFTRLAIGLLMMAYWNWKYDFRVSRVSEFGKTGIKYFMIVQWHVPFIKFLVNPNVEVSLQPDPSSPQ